MVPLHVRDNVSVAIPYCRGMIDAGLGAEVEEDARLALGRDWNPELLALYGRIETSDAVRQLASAEEWLGPHREDPQLFNLLAQFALRAGRPDKARDYVQRGLELKPTPMACKLLGDLLFEAREIVAAGNVYRQGLRILSQEPVDGETLARAAQLLAPASEPAAPGAV
jgi:HemY protein